MREQPAPCQYRSCIMPVKSKKLNIAILVPVKRHRMHSTRAVLEQSLGNTSNRTLPAKKPEHVYSQHSAQEELVKSQYKASTAQHVGIASKVL
jgi:hypothetical protein